MELQRPQNMVAGQHYNTSAQKQFMLTKKVNLLLFAVLEEIE